MIEDKTCPFRFIPPYATVLLCNRSKCEFWSITMETCNVVLGINGILSISDSLQTLIERDIFSTPHKN